MKRTGTTITLPSGLSAHSVAGPVDVAEQLQDARVLDEGSAALAAAGNSLWEAAYPELAAMAEDFLRFDVAGAVLSSWCTGQDLLAAGAATRGNASAEVVKLIEKDVRLAKHPAVDIVVMRQPVATLTFDVVLDVHADVLTGTVRNGTLVSFTGGSCTVTVTLGLGRQELAKGSHTIDQHLAIGLGNGVPLAGIPSQRGARLLHRRPSPAGVGQRDSGPRPRE